MVVNRALSILCCVQCQVAVQPSLVLRHIRDFHQDTKIRIDSDALEEACDVLQVSAVFPQLGRGPMDEVQGLTVLHGVRCKICGHLSTVQRTLEKHITKQHLNACSDQEIELVSLQRLQKNYGELFQIFSSTDMDPSPDDHIITHIRSSADEMLEEAQVDDINDRAVSPWLLTTKWHILFKEYNPEELCQLVLMPEEDEFPGLHDAVSKVAKVATSIIPNASELVLQKLNTPYEAKTYVHPMLV